MTNESKGKPEQKLDATFRTTFTISKCIQRSKQKLRIDFSQELSRLKIKNNLCMSRKYRINFYRPSKKYSTGDIIPLTKKLKN